MKGVTWCKKARKWRAQKYHCSTLYRLGYFKTEEEAIEAMNHFIESHPLPELPQTPSEMNAEFASSRLIYDPETGVLKHRHNKGKVAGSVAKKDLTSYITVSLAGMRFAAHRVAWLIYYGRWPEGDIDHINGIGTDNRICNLREVTRSGNLRNRRIGKNNKSGFIGVSYSKRRNCWMASADGRYIGSFKTKEEAAAARKKYEQENGFHPNHGRRMTDGSEDS